MRIFVAGFLFFTLSIMTARANTQALFNKEGTQATVLLIGMPGDSDPAGFYQALKIPAEDFQGKWSKKLSFPAADGSKGWDAGCVFSKVIENSGTCTLVFRDSPGRIVVNRSLGRATLMITGEEAARFAENFVLPTDTNIIYRSRDGKLQISFAREEEQISWLVVDWNGKGL